MKDFKKILWGAVLLAAGVVLALNALDITNIDIFFPGWWTLFIIIPSLVGVFTDHDKTGSIIGLLIGVGFLLSALNVLDFSYVWKFAIVAVLVVIGIKLIVGGSKKKENFESEDSGIHIVKGDSAATAIFGGKDLSYDGQVFEGGEFTAIFGGVECDLRGAIIEKDCKINATAIFGGVDILLPKNVNVKVSSTNIFGGTGDESERPVDATVTVYVEAVSIFGGVDLK